MSDANLIRQVRLSQHHTVTGRTRHFSRGVQLGQPAELRIIAYAGDTGFYLLYFGADGEEVTDTYHESIQSALEQAEWEFGIGPSEWQTVSQPEE